MLTRPRLILAGVVLLALAGSFATGRFTARPAAVHDETHASTDTRVNDKLAFATAELVNLKRDLAIWQAKAATAEAHTVIVTRWRTLPGGGTEVSQEARADTRSEEHSEGGTKETTQAQRTATTAARRDVQLEQHQEVVTLHTVEARPRLSIAALVGLQRDGANLILPAPVVLGGEADYRVAGPFSVGGWVLVGRAPEQGGGEKTTVAGGLALRLDY